VLHLITYGESPAAPARPLNSFPYQSSHAYVHVQTTLNPAKAFGAFDRGAPTLIELDYLRTALHSHNTWASV